MLAILVMLAKMGKISNMVNIRKIEEEKNWNWKKKI